MNLFAFKPASLALMLGLFTLTLSPSSAAPTDVKPAEPVVKTEAAKAVDNLKGQLVLPGVSLAQGISEVTGVAISPLLGVSALGAWKYWHADASVRHLLPWYCHPYVWGIGLGMIGLCFLKDTLGTAVPALAKKPLDFLELFENKLSALVASVAFVPLVAMAIAQYQRIQGPPDQTLAGLSASGLAVVPMDTLLQYSMHNPWITVPVAVAAFTVVWLSSHAINVLIALSPFGIVDASLKLTKLGLITLVTTSALINPILGAGVSLVFILIGALMAGWSFRLMIFGTLMGRDILLNKRASSEDVRSTGVKVFLARRTEGTPVRTYGRMAADETGVVTFTYRRWLVLPQRRVVITTTRMVLCKGLLHPSLAQLPENTDQRMRNMITLLPRYRRVEETIAHRFGCQDVVDSALVRGIKALRGWFRTNLAPSPTPGPGTSIS